MRGQILGNLTTLKIGAAELAYTSLAAVLKTNNGRGAPGLWW